MRREPRPATGAATPAGPKDATSSDADQVSAGLYQLWVDVEDEPVPDEFFDLLDQIDTASFQASNDA